MNLTAIRDKVDSRLEDLKAGVYCPREVEQYLRGMSAVLIDAGTHETTMLASVIGRHIFDIRKAQEVEA